jgi:stearoyl-CoA desaturase (delta-9 desaturase)
LNQPSVSVLQNAQTPVDPSPAEERPLSVVTGRIWIVNFLGITLPFLGLAAAIFLLWGWGFSWLHLGLLAGMYFFTAMGITVGYHRLFTHRSFETNAVVKFIFAVLGSMAVEGPVLKWVAMHRRHHQHSDHEEDPHSPHHHGSGIRGVLAGMWHAHAGWIFHRDPADLSRYVADLVHDRMVRIASKTWMLWTALGLIIPSVIGGLVSWTWTGALLGFLWGGLARVFLVHHVTWSINSVCHMWGTRPFRSHDESRNNFLFGVLGMGEGWHNNHHAFPTSARHGLRWWQIDVSYWVIRGLALFGLAWKVRVPARDAVLAKRRVSAT